jgi:hypothetical protein
VIVQQFEGGQVQVEDDTLIADSGMMLSPTSDLPTAVAPAS